MTNINQIINGKKEGKWYGICNEGTFEINFENDKRHGKCLWYNTTQNILIPLYYINGKEVAKEQYYNKYPIKIKSYIQYMKDIVKG